MKIKNRTLYDSIYQCLIWCKEHEDTQTIPTTKSRFLAVLGGNYSYFTKFMDDVLIKNGLITTNGDIEHYVDVFKVTQKGKEYISKYEELIGLLGGYQNIARNRP